MVTLKNSRDKWRIDLEGTRWRTTTMVTDEVFREGKMVEYPQQASQVTKMRIVGSIEAKTTDEEPS